MGAANELFTVPGAGHGNFDSDEGTSIYRKISAFLAEHGSDRRGRLTVSRWVP